MELLLYCMLFLLFVYLVLFNVFKEICVIVKLYKYIIIIPHTKLVPILDMFKFLKNVNIIAIT